MLKVWREKTGDVRVAVDRATAEVLGTLPARLRTILTRPDVRGRYADRLFPRAYKDSAANAEYQSLLGQELLRSKLDCITAFEGTLERRRLTRGGVEITVRPEEYGLWLGFVNDMRLVLGTELGITEDGWEAAFDPADARAPEMALLHYLSWLEEALLGAE